MFEQVTVNREVFGNGENLLICGSVMKLPEEIRALAGKAQCVYVDPPFMTGEKFMRRRPYGEKGWRTGTPAPRYPAYEDRYTSEKQYLRLRRRIVECPLASVMTWGLKILSNHVSLTRVLTSFSIALTPHRPAREPSCRCKHSRSVPG